MQRHSGAPSGPPLALLGALTVTTTATVVLLPLVAGRQGSPSELPGLAVVGWVIGALVGLGLFAVFRSVDTSRSGSPHYTIPSWRPQLLAVGLAVAGWIGAFAHALTIAHALALR